MTLTFADIKIAIIASLTPDLLEPKWQALLKPGKPPETGHCAVAAESFYHLAGGKEAGFMPVVCTYYADAKREEKIYKGQPTPEQLLNGWHKETHWWICGHKNGGRGKGDVFDVTARQYNHPFSYEHGRNVGFMQPQQQPSKRAKIVIDRVIKKRGRSALENYKSKNIMEFKIHLNSLKSARHHTFKR